MSSLTITKDDPSIPARFTGPHGTVTCEVNEDVLNVLVKPSAAAADWDMALGLMARIADPAHWLARSSALSGVDWWSIQLA